MQTLLFATGSEGKFCEAQKILEELRSRFWLEKVDLDVPEIQETSTYIVAGQKAIDAYEKLQKPVLVEDTGLAIHAWGGLPGALIKWYLKSVGIEGILKKLTAYRNLNATAFASFAYCNGTEPQIFHGKLEGKIAEKPRGNRNFGWDPIFIPEGHKRTLAEMTPEEKNAISHRRKALDNLLKNLKI